MEIPEHLNNANLINAPYEIQNYVTQTCNGFVLFMDDIRFSTSVRNNKTIIINTRGTYWANYISHPINAKSFEETILLRLLHEVGHVHFNHPGDAQFDSRGQLIRGTESPFEGRELEAWSFAFNLRESNNKSYNSLLKVIEDWVKNHEFENKDWENNLNDQLILRNKFC